MKRAGVILAVLAAFALGAYVARRAPAAERDLRARLEAADIGRDALHEALHRCEAAQPTALHMTHGQSNLR